MKKLIKSVKLAMVLCCLALGSKSLAKDEVLGVRIRDVPAHTPTGVESLLEVTHKGCDGSFPTANATVKKIGVNTALVSLELYPGTCANPTQEIKQLGPLDLESVG